ncbi:MAG: ParA family protein [Clostridia bacterium]|nr:ParA family protein [Clostridia bacterium]
MFCLQELKNNIIICGHFGCGKTNVAVGLALDMARAGRRLGIVDLDIVNPYFRTADSVPELERAGVDCFIPQFANTNVDIPSLGGEISAVFARQTDDPFYTAIFDVGGDNGAIALRRYRPELEKRGYSMLFVASMYRPLTETAEDAVAGLREIEACSGLHATAFINNSNIGRETSADDIAASLTYTDKICELTSLPCLAVTLHNASYAKQLHSKYPEYNFTVISDSTKKLF